MVRFIKKLFQKSRGSLPKTPACIDCKNHGDHKLFRKEEIDQFGFKDLSVCIRCMVPCGICRRPISKKMSVKNRFCHVCTMRLPSYPVNEPILSPGFRQEPNNSSMFLSASGIGTCSYLCGS